MKKTKGKLDCKEQATGLRMNEHTLDALVSPGYYKIEVRDATASEGFPEEISHGRLSAYLEVTANNRRCDRLKDSAIGQVLTVTDSNGLTNIYSRSRINSNGVNTWSTWSGVGGKSAGDIMDGAITMPKLSSDVRKEFDNISILENSIIHEKNAIVNGNTVVGAAREIYSSHGKNDTATFLKRSTAGGTTIGNSVATLRQIGGNIINNLVDGVTANSFWGVTDFVNDIFYSNPDAGGLTLKPLTGIIDSTHKYYISITVYSSSILYLQDLSSNVLSSINKNAWEMISTVNTAPSGTQIRLYESGDGKKGLYMTRPLIIDLTEMYGLGKEPTKVECDKIFSTMGVLSYGLNIAQPPTGYKSIGFNQCNPENILIRKTVLDGIINDSDETSIAVIECIPCKIGVGENNGYVVGYGEGDEWNDSGIEVYFTPLNPIGNNDELYIHKLERDSTYNTYLPSVSGYLLVVTPYTDKFCVHLHWSGDRPTTYYEPYFESSLSLPVIPQMSMWGLAAIVVDGIFIQDTIDLEKRKYIRRIGKNESGFYALESPQEYPIETKLSTNYISNDYGVEEFIGTKVPLAANILFYMRSFVSEIRNFLDRIMAGSGTTDVTLLADKIVSVL